MPQSVSRALAEPHRALSLPGPAPDVVAHAKLYLLDTIGAMLAAAAPRYPASRIMMRFVRELGGTRESTLVGQGARTSCVDAALANGTLAYYCDIEPLHVGAILHAPGGGRARQPGRGRAGGERRPALPRLDRARRRGGDPRLVRLRSGRALRPRLSSERGGGRLRRGGGGRPSLPPEPGAAGGGARPRDAAGLGPPGLGQ